MRFEADATEHHVLPDGTAVTLRAVQPSDRGELDRQFRRMSPDSRYRRFFSGIAELTPEMLDYLTVVDGHDHFAIVATVDSLDLKAEQGVGVARFVRMTDAHDVAEAAVTVVDDFQGRGLGRLLLSALVAAALERGVEKFRSEVLASNEPMRRLLEGNGVTGVETGDGTLVFDAPLETQPSAVIRRIFREAAASMIVWLNRLYPPAREIARRS